MSVGNRVFTEVNRPSKELMDLFEGIPSSNINDQMNRLYNFHEYMKLLNPQKFSGSLVGPAFTVKCPAGDNLFFHQALDMAEPGDILVIDADGCSNRSVAGGIMMRFACAKGIAGIIVDGYMRDLDDLQDISMPVYARGITPQGPYKNGPGEINVPVSCGGQVVFPGDIIVGDSDGLVVIRQQDAEEIGKASKAKKADEDVTFATIAGDVNAYAQKHLNSTAERMQGRTPEFVNCAYIEKYKI